MGLAFVLTSRAPSRPPSAKTHNPSRAATAKERLISWPISSDFSVGRYCLGAWRRRG
jgi:hypothetical protein